MPAMTSRGPGAQHIAGRFAPMERLGRAGHVWRAFDTQQHSEVAMRELRPVDAELAAGDPLGADSLRQRVLHEAASLARLRHPNVVVIRDLVDAASERYPWLVMELVAGGSLEDHLGRRLLTPREAASVGRSLVAALSAARAIGLLHRNLKPSNVLLRPDGTPLLTDFALAFPQPAGRLAGAGVLTGPPDYVAPERVRGEEGDPASDLWSLGMVLYVAVTGRNPLHRGTDLATMAAVLDQPLPLPPQAGPLAEVLSALLVRDPVARPGLDVLDRMLADAERGQAVRTAPPGPGVDPFAPGTGTGTGTGYRAVEDRRPAWTSEPADEPVRTYQGRNTQDEPGPAPDPDPVPKRAPSGPKSGSRRVPVVIASVAAIGLVGALLWVFTSGGSADATAPPGSAPTAGPSSASPAAGPDLLTTAGMNTLISALPSAIGGSQVLQMTVYPTYAIVEVQDKANSSTYDNYEYSGGHTKSLGSGGSIAPGYTTTGLNSVNWNILPGLLEKANMDLGVQNPITRYVVLDPNWPSAGSGASLRVYIANANGEGYLLSDPNGNILSTYPFTT